MFSVTQRIKTVIQPMGGYVPKKLFKKKQYNDKCEVLDVKPAFSSIQGLAVDYLTRFMLFHDKLSAFDISIQGAQRIDNENGDDNEYRRVMSLLDNVNGLDDTSIYNACKIVCYDIALRQGVSAYRCTNEIEPPAELIQNIRVLVKRGVRFLERVGPIVTDEFTFAGGYTNLVNSGDGDYLTEDMIIDFKVSKSNFSSAWSLQLLMYYLLGIHSIHEEFQTVTSLCIFNPYRNQSYIVKISDISDESKYKVSHEVLGYKMEQESLNDDFSSWKKVQGSDDEILEKYLEEHSLTDFDITKYADGIHNISVDDYWTYMCTINEEYCEYYPKFRYVDHVSMIKKNGYVMFLSVSPKGKLCVLNGGAKKKVSFSPEYYYDNIERYAGTVMSYFSNYWDALYSLSEEIKQLTPDEKYMCKAYCKSWKSAIQTYDEWCNGYMRFSGRVHGCIVDIDYYNHIYLNPYDGSVIPYFAPSPFSKYVYKSTVSLFADRKPEMLQPLKNWIKENPQSSLALTVQDTRMQLLDVPREELIGEDEKDAADDADSHDLAVEEIDKDYDIALDDTSFIRGYNIVLDTDMYPISRRLKPLQKIYDAKLVQAWYDDVLKEDQTLLEDKYLYVEPKTTRRKRKDQQNSLPQKSKDQPDSLSQKEYLAQSEQPHQKLPQNQIAAKEKYMGMTRTMNCGMPATVIDYVNCRDITIQFEDGLVKSHVRADKFMNGNVVHAEN